MTIRPYFGTIGGFNPPSMVTISEMVPDCGAVQAGFGAASPPGRWPGESIGAFELCRRVLSQFGCWSHTQRKQGLQVWLVAKSSTKWTLLIQIIRELRPLSKGRYSEGFERRETRGPST